jgi:hypothetical protein
MRRVFVALLLCSGLTACGCGAPGSSSSAAMPTAPHGGNIVPLPGGKGFAELVVERGAPSKGATAGTSRLVAYFYQPDCTTVLAPPPSDVKVHLGSADRGSDVKLTSQTTPAGQFASERGQYPDALAGELALTVGGEPVQATFSFR